MTEDTRKLLEKSRWTDPTDLFIGDIIEYDMKDGGLSIIQEEQLLPPKMIESLKKIPKGVERDSVIGKLRYSKNPNERTIPKKLEEFFRKYRLLFGERNELDAVDIFSVKRDAIFLKRYVYQTEIGEYINFREKHTYDIYFLLGKDELQTNLKSRHVAYEVFYNSYTDDIAIKGISDDVLSRYHMTGIVPIIKRYLKYIVKFDYEGATKYMVNTIDDYKYFRLPIDVYREFNSESLFILHMDNKTFGVDELDMSYKELMDIRFNFNHILVPMLNMASLGIGKNNSRQIKSR